SLRDVEDDDLFKKQFTFEGLSELFKVKDDSLHIAIIELASRVLEGQRAILSAIASSYFSHLMKLGGAESFVSLDVDAMELGIRSRMQKLFSDPAIGLSSVMEITTKNVDTIAQKISNISKEDGDRALFDFYEQASSKVKSQLDSLVNRFREYCKLVENDTVYDLLNLASYDESLFLLLDSPDAQDRVKGYQELWKLAPSAQEVQRAISSILTKVTGGIS
ncbi:MAG: hypothetical protein JSS12_08760, partial [Verrucomicrobia bacterium]|nr:hypothetical protein [Verrucomicrobiota bacterium]